jgi:uncharacterized protein YjbJ (UPF0337 family)
MPLSARRLTMGDKTDRATGTLKETAGVATNDPKLVREGRREQAKDDPSRRADSNRGPLHYE